MKRNVIKIVISILILMVIISIANISFALDLGDLNSYAQTGTGGTEKLVSFASTMLSLLQYIGIAGGAIIIMVIGIKFMMAGAEEKAEYKEKMVPWIIGAFLIMAGSATPNAIYKMVNSATGTETETTETTTSSIVIYDLERG